MKILLLSNQGMVAPFVGNPIMLRYRDAILSDSSVESVDMLRCKNPFKVRMELRRKAKQADLIHLHFGGMYALIVWFLLIGIDKPKFITFHGTDIHAKAFKTAKSVLTKIKIKLNQYASFLSILCYTKIRANKHCHCHHWSIHAIPSGQHTNRSSQNRKQQSAYQAQQLLLWSLYLPAVHFENSLRENTTCLSDRCLLSAMGSSGNHHHPFVAPRTSVS